MTGGEDDGGAALVEDGFLTPLASFLQGGEGEKREAAVTTMGKVVVPYASGNGRGAWSGGFRRRASCVAPTAA